MIRNPGTILLAASLFFLSSVQAMAAQFTFECRFQHRKGGSHCSATGAVTNTSNFVQVRCSDGFELEAPYPTLNPIDDDTYLWAVEDQAHAVFLRFIGFTDASGHYRAQLNAVGFGEGSKGAIPGRCRVEVPQL